MPRKHQAKKPPSVSQRPFPWRCHECGERAVELVRIQYEATLRHDGRLHSFVVPDLEIPRCSACGANVFTESVDRQIATAYRIHANLLLPEQLRSAFQRVGKQQKEVSGHLGVAEESLSRWLNEAQIQSRSMDTLLRIYFGFPEVRNALEDEFTRGGMGLADCKIN